MKPVVLDASAAVEIALRTWAGRRLQRELPELIEVWVAEHFYVETAGVLRRAVARGDLGYERARRALDRLLSLAVQRASVKPLVEEAWGLRNNVTIADAIYVALARHLDASLATLDTRLARAPNLGIDVVTVSSQEHP